MKELDYEAELARIIGKKGKDISVSDANLLQNQDVGVPLTYGGSDPFKVQPVVYADSPERSCKKQGDYV